VIHLKDVLGVILGGGRGTRLHPLTHRRSKPAVPIAGKYRLIDIPISNCINSGIFRIAVLTQFNSVSLHRHIAQTYNFDAFHTGWVQILAAEQTPDSASWYQGTADAVRKQLNQIRSTHASHVLILAGDHLYRMDYAKMAAFHDETGAEVTVAVQPVSRTDAGRFGVLKRDHRHRITAFAEKPKDPVTLEEMVSREDAARPYLGSLGIYLFKTSVLEALLQNPSNSDFGTDIIPKALKTHGIFGFDFDDYWEDIGTIRSFYETNLALTQPKPPFNLFDPDRPIYTHARFLPGSTVEDSSLRNVLLTEGCRIRHAEVSDSILGLRSQISQGTRIRSSIIMGSDTYDRSTNDGIPVGIGPGCEIEGAIIDKNACIGANVVIRAFPKGHPDVDTETWLVRDGIVCVPKDVSIPANTHIGPDESIQRDVDEAPPSLQ